MVLRLKTKKESTSTSVEPRLLRVAEAARYLNVAVWCLRGLVWRKEITPIKIGQGRRLLFDKADLDSFIERLKAA